MRHGDVDKLMSLNEKMAVLFIRLREIKYNNLEQFLIGRNSQTHRSAKEGGM